MVIVALHAETGINLLHMVFVDLIAVDFSIRIIKQGVSIVQPVRCLDDSRKLTDGTYESHIYVLPMTGGEPKDLTGPGLSYLHGWSPDGKELAYCAFRKKPEEETMRIEICTIPSDGGEEIRHTCIRPLLVLLNRMSICRTCMYHLE